MLREIESISTQETSRFIAIFLNHLVFKCYLFTTPAKTICIFMKYDITRNMGQDG